MATLHHVMLEVQMFNYAQTFLRDSAAIAPNRSLGAALIIVCMCPKLDFR
jgi:hypothetical protein